jgi:hypothetical protein
MGFRALVASGEAVNHFDGIMPLKLVTVFAWTSRWSTVIGEMAHEAQAFCLPQWLSSLRPPTHTTRKPAR